MSCRQRALPEPIDEESSASQDAEWLRKQIDRFERRNLKIGDPITITNRPELGELTVTELIPGRQRCRFYWVIGTSHPKLPYVRTAKYRRYQACIVRPAVVVVAMRRAPGL